MIGDHRKELLNAFKITEDLKHSLDVKIISIESLISRIIKNQIVFKKNENKFSSFSESRFIESILMGIPVNPVIFSSDKDNIWTVEDGQKRLRSFINLAFYLRELDEEESSLVSGKLYNRFFETEIKCIISDPTISHSKIQDIVIRLNTKG